MILRAICDRIVLIGGVIVGAATAGFPSHFRQRMSGRLDQVSEDLAPFRSIADRHHEGSIEALVQHHLNSSDPTFYEEGVAIQNMIDSEERLRRIFEALDANVFDQLTAILRYADADDIDAAMRLYEPSIVFSADRIILAIIIGAGLWLLFLAFWQLTTKMISLVLNRT